MDGYELPFENPFDNMSDEEFLYRIMNPEDPMYMGDDPCDDTDEFIIIDDDE